MIWVPAVSSMTASIVVCNIQVYTQMLVHEYIRTAKQEKCSTSLFIVSCFAHGNRVSANKRVKPCEPASKLLAKSQHGHKLTETVEGFICKDLRSLQRRGVTLCQLGKQLCDVSKPNVRKPETKHCNFFTKLCFHLSDFLYS